MLGTGNGHLRDNGGSVFDQHDGGLKQQKGEKHGQTDHSEVLIENEMLRSEM